MILAKPPAKKSVASWICVSGQILLLGWFSPLSKAQDATPAILNGWSFTPENNQVELELTGTTIPKYFILAEPPSIIIDLPNTQLGKVSQKSSLPGTIKSIELVQLDNNVTEIILTVAPDTNLSPSSRSFPQQIHSNTPN
jgi:hypothetical protein